MLNKFPRTYSASSQSELRLFNIDIDFSSDGCLTATLELNAHQRSMLRLNDTYPGDVVHKFYAMVLIDGVYDHLCKLAGIDPDDAIRAIFISNGLEAPGMALSLPGTSESEVVWEVPADTLAFLKGFLIGTATGTDIPVSDVYMFTDLMPSKEAL